MLAKGSLKIKEFSKYFAVLLVRNSNSGCTQRFLSARGLVTNLTPILLQAHAPARHIPPNQPLALSLSLSPPHLFPSPPPLHQGEHPDH